MDSVRTRVIIAIVCVLAVDAGCTFSWQGPSAGGATPLPAATSMPSPSPSAAASGLAPQTPLTPRMDIEHSLRLLEDHASLLRGLRRSKEIPLQLVSPEDFRAGARESCLGQRTEGTLTTETLTMLGLLGNDLVTEADDVAFASEWAAGVTSLYDPTSHSILLSDPPSFDASFRLDYLAAYLAALRVEALGSSPSAACCPMACAWADDAGMAMAALLVGDTRLAQEQWVRIYGDREDAARMQGLLSATDETSLFAAPRFLGDTYAFILAGGRAFTQDLYLSAGWAAVDAAYADPPVSTEQILHPERYPEDGPLALQAPNLEGALGPSWELAQTTVLGEWRTRQTLQVYLSPEEAAEAAADWGGDVLMTYHDTQFNEDLLLLITRWDTLRQAQDFALAFRKYGEARFGERRPTAQADTWTWEGGYSLLERGSDQTLWMLGPDKATVEAARSGVTFPVSPR